MGNSQNHWKLGLFVVAGTALALTAAALLGVRSMQKKVGLYVSYFDESVQGLEVGSPIKFRGVTIGTIRQIHVAPDRRHVEVESALGVEELTRLGLDIAKDKPLFGTPKTLQMSADLRMQLASGGLTGVKFLELDFFDVTRYPPPVLPFPVPNNYIPTASSMMKSLEDSIILIADRLPEIAKQVEFIAGDIRLIVKDVSEQMIPNRITSTFDKMDSLLDTAQQALIQTDVKKLSKNANQMLYSVDSAAKQLDRIISRLDRKDGLVANIENTSGHLNHILADIDRNDGLIKSLERASDSIGDTLRNAEGIGGRLSDTLESLQTLARSMRKLTEALEQDPDMLLKGRSPERK